jgi:hypothetical protein
MEETSSEEIFRSPKNFLDDEYTDSTEDFSDDFPEDLDRAVAGRTLYFVNEDVEWLLTQYLWTGCTSVVLRDQIMSNATELIRQIIRKQGLHTIYPGHEESAFGDLLQTAWVQIERTLYKYKSRPHCRLCYNPDRPSESLLYEPSHNEYGIKTFEEVIKMHSAKCPKCGGRLTAEPLIQSSQGRFGGSESILFRGMSKVFNMWSQIARTVILAYIKKESRDRRNATVYKTRLVNKHRPVSDIMTRFFGEAREMCKYNQEHLLIIAAMEKLTETDEKPHDGIIGKLVQQTGLSRSAVTGFLKIIKLRSFEFTDSPINKGSESTGSDDNRRFKEIEDKNEP